MEVVNAVLSARMAEGPAILVHECIGCEDCELPTVPCKINGCCVTQIVLSTPAFTLQICDADCLKLSSAKNSTYRKGRAFKAVGFTGLDICFCEIFLFHLIGLNKNSGGFF